MAETPQNIKSTNTARSEKTRPVKGMSPDTQATWDELTRLGREIGRGWRSPQAGSELLSEMRR